MAKLLPHVPLIGTRITLTPLTREHLDALLAAAQRVGPEGNLTWVPRSQAAAEAYVQHAQRERAEGRALPFVIIDRASEQLVGTTRLGSIEYWEPDNALPQVVEIGWTWLAREARRTYVNTEAKLLLLRYAFDTLHVERVTLKTDSRNQRSRDAIARIGASFEGILRSHMRAYDGGLRDTAIFSIIAAEWPGVQEKLERAASRDRDSNRG